MDLKRNLIHIICGSIKKKGGDKSVTSEWRKRWWKPLAGEKPLDMEGYQIKLIKGGNHLLYLLHCVEHIQVILDMYIRI